MQGPLEGEREIERKRKRYSGRESAGGSASLILVESWMER